MTEQQTQVLTELATIPAARFAHATQVTPYDARIHRTNYFYEIAWEVLPANPRQAMELYGAYLLDDLRDMAARIPGAIQLQKLFPQVSISSPAIQVFLSLRDIRTQIFRFQNDIYVATSKDRRFASNIESPYPETIRRELTTALIAMYSLSLNDGFTSHTDYGLRRAIIHELLIIDIPVGVTFTLAQLRPVLEDSKSKLIDIDAVLGILERYRKSFNPEILPSIVSLANGRLWRGLGPQSKRLGQVRRSIIWSVAVAIRDTLGMKLIQPEQIEHYTRCAREVEHLFDDRIAQDIFLRPHSK